jgi:hypothetical protein
VTFEDRLETVQPIIRMIGSGLSLGLVLVAGQKAILDDVSLRAHCSTEMD